MGPQVLILPLKALTPSQISAFKPEGCKATENNYSSAPPAALINQQRTKYVKLYPTEELPQGVTELRDMYFRTDTLRLGSTVLESEEGYFYY